MLLLGRIMNNIRSHMVRSKSTRSDVVVSSRLNQSWGHGGDPCNKGLTPKMLLISVHTVI